MFIKRNQCCADCHFFVEEQPTPSGEPFTLAISDAERVEAKQDDFSWMSSPAKLACSFGVWDEGFESPRRDRHKTIALTNRRNFCFWWRYRPGMMIPAAKILQERQAKDREASRDRKLTRWGLWIAALALVANIFFTIMKEMKVWPFH